MIGVLIVCLQVLFSLLCLVGLVLIALGAWRFVNREPRWGSCFVLGGLCLAGSVFGYLGGFATLGALTRAWA